MNSNPYELERLLSSRIAKLPREMVGYYANPDHQGDDDNTWYKFLAVPTRYPWGSCAWYTHQCVKSTEPTTFTTTIVPHPSVHFITDSVLILPASATVNKWIMKLGVKDVQVIDSWFAADIINKYKRGTKYQSFKQLHEKVLHAPFFYTESLLKSFPLFLPNTPPPVYEFEISGLSADDVSSVRMMNEYCSSDIETTSVRDVDRIPQYFPSFITTTTEISSTFRHVEIPLNSNKNVVKSLYFRIYNGKSQDLEDVESIEIKPSGEKFPVPMCRQYFKTKYFSDISEIPYYVIPFCPNPKSNVQEYGEVFGDGDVLVLQLSDHYTRDDKKIDVTLEVVNKIVWTTTSAT